MPLLPNKSASDVIFRIQSRTLFAGYAIQRQAVEERQTIHTLLDTGSAAKHATSSLVPVYDGAALTTPEEEAAFLATTTTRTTTTTTTAAVIPVPPSSGTSLNAFVRTFPTTYAGLTVSPQNAGALSINSQSVGNYDYTYKTGNQTIASGYTVSDWFTTTQDTHSAVIIVDGNLTINSGVTLSPSVRKLFTLLYVTGNLVCNGTISMSARGANHSGSGSSGGATTAVAIRIGTGTFGAVTNPEIPATGGAGATGTTTDNGVVNGTAGSNGGSGGGGAGGKFLGASRSGNGAAGTCFSGGSGGGGVFNSASNGGDAVANGGKGGDGRNTISAGGSGNPGGTGTGAPFGPDGNPGTGGTLIVIVGGTFSGTGGITANGVNGARADGQVGGGGSGGGSVTVLFGTDSSSITPAATGGLGFASGGGGNGTARKLALGGVVT